MHLLPFAHSFLLLLGVAIVAAVDPNLFSSSSMPRDGYVPNVGNGFLGYDVGCPSNDESSSAGYMFVAGTYSGNSSITPSRRALLPHQQAIFAQSVTCGSSQLQEISWTATLDIAEAIYSNTTTFTFDSCTCIVELSWIAHRTIYNTSFLHLSTFGSDQSCTFILSTCNGNYSSDFRQVSSDHMNSTSGIVQGAIYETLLPEKPEGGPLTNVSVVYNEIPLTLNGQEDFISVMVVWSTAWESEGHPVVTLSDLFENLLEISFNTWEDILSAHIAGWDEIWQSGIEISGNDTVAASVNASLYYILSSVNSLAPWSISPGGLPKNSYNGHVFWDCETWMLPAIVPFFPDIAKSFVQYRTNRLDEAINRAEVRGLDGAMYPWESAFTGIDVTPVPNIEGDYEIHVTADIPLAARLVWYWIDEEDWIEEKIWEMIENCANYFVSRVSCLVPDCSQYSLFDVMPPDERAGVVNHSVYTNAAASVLLDWISSDMAYLLKSDDSISIYQDIAKNMYIPVSDTLYAVGQVHPEYDGYDGEPINQADTVLLQFPLLYSMSDEIAYNDLRYYENLTSLPGVTRGFYTGDSSYSIAYLSLYRKEDFFPSDGADLKVLADQQFEVAFDHIDSSHFYIWHETVEGGHVNFVTGAGGFLQNIIYGYGGLLADASGLIIDTPILPNLGVTEITFRRLKYGSATFSISFDDSEMTITVNEGTLYIYEQQSDDASDFTFVTKISIGENSPLTLPSQKILITTEKVKNGSDTSDDTDNVESFFKQYHPYIIVGGLLLLSLFAYFIYSKCLHLFLPGDDQSVSLFSKGDVHTDSKL